VGKFLPLGRTGLCWRIILKWILKIEYNVFDWIDLAQGRKNGGPVGTL
jgi:hypothetical protein